VSTYVKLKYMLKMFTYKLTVSRICLYVGIRTYVKFTHACTCNFKHILTVYTYMREHKKNSYSVA